MKDEILKDFTLVGGIANRTTFLDQLKSSLEEYMDKDL